ncbi:SDR family oxidoreductase [Microvirga yunnanensis]|uniref:SDR family oxidoreductase n=1 Tax=Microvirga yunnanensis TaxID=2953740 RepID=UPI0021C78AA4|nr:SDR family NAD(P)-dependent oxidoreductase [Microvirga sp. HBU65207]
MLNGKIALVTGAGSGIGKASAKALAAQGAEILALGIVEAELVALCSEIEQTGGKARFALADISDFEQVRSGLALLLEASGRLDIVVANAGINGVWAPIDDLQPDEWHKTISVNLTGTYNTLHLTVPYLKQNGGGSIVIVSSMNGTRIFTTAGATAYIATKAAQFAMAQQLALELAKHRIRVNAVCPGQISTSIGDSTVKRNTIEAAIPVHWPEGDIPISGGRPGEPDDIAQAIMFLSSPQAKHITGTPIWIDGGQSLLR